ncbi:HEAT repeat-containing protein 1-like [Paramacrobiotus metropolitanus]|uniref:HEAT repeat-containing protein 1-like n=1 Tax=Paramacrobiotus metropolitanus TaxID=2943436 RepID=UPI0024458DAB|nr:HEAT repeat-containing protein 1-like [Paramacrobiotus metropolitanus]
MATSLASQLKALAVPQTSAFARGVKKRASLLFDPSEAAKYDHKEILQISLEGLHDLQLLNEDFARYEDILFSPVSMEMERSVQNKELNAKLDENIGEFLRMLAPYFLHRPAHKALEWLIVRFHIHQYNVEAVMMMVLPFHDTNIFVRMVQVLEFSYHKKWLWLEGIQRKGVPLQTPDLLKYLTKQPWLLELLLTELAKRSQNHWLVSVQNDVFLKFVIQICLGIFSNTSVDNEIIALIVPNLSQCLQSTAADYRAAAYACLAVMVRQLPLEKAVVGKIIAALMIAAGKFSDAVGVDALAACTSELGTVPKEMMDYLLNNGKFVELVWDCIKQHNLGKLLAVIFRTGTKMLFAKGNLPRNALVDLMKKLLGEVSVEESQQNEMLRYFVAELLRKKNNVADVDLTVGQLVAVLRSTMPSSWNAVLAERGRENGHLLERLDMTLMNEMSEEIIGKLPHTTSIFLKLNHPNPVMRIDAVKTLVESSEELSAEFIREMVGVRLKDREVDVLAALFEAPSVAVLRKAYGDDVNSVLEKTLCAIYKDADRKKWADVEGLVLRALMGGSDLMEYLPFLLTALLSRKYPVFAENPTFSAKFPLTNQALSSETSLFALLDAVSNDILTNHATKIPACISRYFSLLSSPDVDLPLWTSFLTITVFIRLIGDRSEMLASAEGCTLFDIISSFLSRIYISSKEVDTTSGEVVVKMLKRGKMPVGVLLDWFGKLFSMNEYFLGDGTARKVLLRAARLALESVKKLKHRALFEQTVALYVKKMVRVLKDVEEMLTAMAEAGSGISPALRSSVLSFAAQCVALISPDTLHDETAVSLLAVILPSLNNQHIQIRRHALLVCRNIVARHKISSPEVKQLLQVLVSQADRMEVDGFIVSQVLADVLAGATSERTREFWLDVLFRPVGSERLGSVAQLEMLKALRLVQSVRILVRLKPVMEKLLATYDTLDSTELEMVNELAERYSGAFRGSDAQGPWEVDMETMVLATIEHALRLPGRCGIASPAEVVLRNFQFFDREKFGDGLFNRILNKILKFYVEKANPAMNSSFRRYLKHVRLPAELILHQLNGRIAEGDAKRKKLSGALARMNDPARKTVTFWRHANDLLELLLNKKKVTGVRRVVEELCELLKESIVLTGDEDLMEQVEMVRQKVFAVINFTVSDARNRLRPSSLKTSPRRLDIAVIVDCLRASSNIHTQLAGLALLSTLAQRLPSTILQSCMSIFSLTGSHLLHKEDEYSLNMILRIIDAIVPVILQTAASTADAVRAIWEVLVDALPHIPPHRRGLLFGRVVEVTGEEGLWIGMVLLGTLYVGKGLAVEPEGKSKKFGYPVLCEFLGELFERCDQGMRVESVRKVVEFVVAETGVLDAQTWTAKRKHVERIRFEKPLIPANLPKEQQIQLVSVAMSFISYYFPMESQKAGNDADASLEGLLTALLNIQFHARANSTQRPPAERPLWADLLAKSSAAATEVLGKMSWSTFVTIMDNILKKAEDESALKMALEELGGALSVRDRLPTDDVNLLKPLVNTIIQILQGGVTSADTDEDAATAGKRKRVDSGGHRVSISPVIQRGCLYCLRQLVMILGKELWPPVLRVCLNCLNAEDGHALSESLLTIGAIIRCAKLGVLPKLPKLMPLLVLCLTRRASSGGVDVVSGVDVMESGVSVLGGLLSPFLAAVLRLIALWRGVKVKDGLRKQFDAGLEKLEGVVTGGLAFRMVFAAVKEAFEKTDETKDVRVALLRILSVSLAKLPKPQVAEMLSLQRPLVDFLLSVLEQHHEAASTLALDTLSSLVLYMPDSVFRGLFMRIYQWVISSESGERWVVFFRIVARLTDTLKLLFTIFASTVIGQTVKLMEALHVVKGESGQFAKTDVRVELLNEMFGVLSRFFKFDVEGFFNADQYDILMQPLINQLDNFHDTVSYLRSSPALIACIADFVVCLNDDSLWKPLHYQICLKSRSEIAEVRIAALQTLSALAEKLGEAYGDLLPEAMTFLVELAEDDDEGVERQCQATKAVLEKVLGQSTVWQEELTGD